MKIIKATHVEQVRHVALEWKETCNAGKFGLTIDIETYFTNLGALILRYEADLLLLTTDTDEVVGFIGIETFHSPLDNQKCAAEHHWYIMEKYRGSGAMRMLIAVKDWAKERGCTHLIMNASTLASDLHDRVCGFYESVGMVKFETSFIQEII